MLKTIIKKGTYQDSVALMLLTGSLSSTPGVKKVSIMMATDANKGVFEQSGLLTDELKTAKANDMAIVADVDSDDIMLTLDKEVDKYFRDQAASSKPSDSYDSVRSWEAAEAAMPDADMAVISIPGTYAAIEADRALDEGLHVFMFSDNVSVEDEARLKRKAHEKGLVVMGPDCGTGIVCGVPVAFTNNVEPGGIGIVGASGTGIQELTAIIDRMGCGVTNAIGTGGRDLYTDIGGITMLDCIEAMEHDPSARVVIVISKPPAKVIRDKVMARLSQFSKPVVTLFLGECPEYHEAGLYHAYTLDEAARIAVELLKGESVKQFIPEMPEGKFFDASENKTIRAYYSGGTLAGEAAMMIKDSLGIKLPPEKQEGFMLNHGGHVVVDLGDDVYTQGKPHPMIDPAKRIECMESAADDPSTGVILLDIVMGYGSHEDMASALLPAIKKLQAQAAEQKRRLWFVATVCGTRKDFQDYDCQVRLLRDSGVIVCETNMIAVATAIHIIGHEALFVNKEIRAKAVLPCEKRSASEKVTKMLAEKPKIINVGLKSFAKVASDFGCKVVQFDWAPPAGGDYEMMRALRFLREYRFDGGCEFNDIGEANNAVIERVIASVPVLKDVVPAYELIPEMREGKVLLHAGPPIRWENMTDPMKGSCVGASLFEGWAETEAEARALLSSGKVRFIPCHHVQAVGPMGGITSPHMPLLVVENEAGGNRAYCTMNEGIGKVLRFGAYSQEVVDRLIWMRDVLGPVLSKALKTYDDGLALNPLIAKAISMGDEFHQRNIAASLLFLKEMSPRIVTLPISEELKYAVTNFLAVTDQFFLNIMMACAKSVMDDARRVTVGTVVTAMCRNGENFGIRISGMGDEWFTAPVNTPQGLYFTGYTGADASPDLGDSAITETYGVGGMAMIAAPAVTRFVGAGGFDDALRTSDEMMEIVISRNPNFTVPTWNFQGICLGIDARKVVEKEITPVINTGIAHKIAGFGQIGAGTVHPPLECFRQAVLAYAEKLGF